MNNFYAITFVVVFLFGCSAYTLRNTNATPADVFMDNDHSRIQWKESLK